MRRKREVPVLSVGDLIRDNDPRNERGLLEIVAISYHLEKVQIRSSEGRKTWIKMSSIHFDGKERHGGYSAISVKNWNPIDDGKDTI